MFKGGRGRRDYVVINDFLGRLSHPIKVVIAGNHDYYPFDSCTQEEFRGLMSNATYLENDFTELPNGLRIWGSPNKAGHLREYSLSGTREYKKVVV